MAIKGLTDPYRGLVPAARVYAGGHTFRWVRGDRYVAVQKGICVDNRRVFIIRDTLAGHEVLEGYRPLIDAIPVTAGENWNDPCSLKRIAATWLAKRSIDHGV